MVPFTSLFSFECGELLGAELVAFSVGEDAVDGAGNVAEKESDRREPERLRIDLSIGQPCGPLGQVVEGQFKRVQNGAARGRNVGVGSAEPGFGVGGGWQCSWQQSNGRDRSPTSCHCHPGGPDPERSDPEGGESQP